MTRNIKQAINDYDQQLENTNRGEFFMSDYEQLIEISTPENCSMPDIFELITNSLKAGYMLGARAAACNK